LIRKKPKQCRGRRSLIALVILMADCERVADCCHEPLALLTHLMRVVTTIMITISNTQSISSN
jgi:hypothetical protein